MRKRLISLGCAAMIILSLCACARAGWAQQMETRSNRYTQPDAPYEQVVSALDTEGFELVATSGMAQLWLNREMHTIRLTDTRSGYVWGAIPLQDARNLNTSWKSYAAAIVALECFDSKFNEKRYGLTGNAAVTYSLQPDGFSFEAHFEALGIRLAGYYILRDNVLTCGLAPDSFREEGQYLVKSLAFSPYLGCVFGDETPGWFLLPDGPGALMRFRAGGTYISGYDQRVYGKDLAIETLETAQSLGVNRPGDYLVAEKQANVPVYGIVHGVGQHGLLVEIEDGETYASIAATPAGLGNTRYNSIMARFEYRQKYSKATTRSGAGSLVPQDDYNRMTPKLSYHLLTGPAADYDQMAVYYRGLLLDEGRLLPGKEQAGLKLEFLGTDIQKRTLLKTWQAFTHLSDIPPMVEALEKAGIGPLQVVLRQFSHHNKAGEGLSKALGREQELRALQTSLTDQGYLLLVYLDPVRANRDQIRLRVNAANTMAKSPIAIHRLNPDLVYPETYFFRPGTVADNVAGHQARFAGFPAAVDQLGSRFYADHTTGHAVNRAQAQQAFLSLLSGLSNDGGPALYNPALPAWSLATAYYDMPLTNSQYLFEDDTVPFLPIVLKGSLSMYAPPLNIGVSSRERLLRLVEYGVCPSFMITQSQSDALTNTPLEDWYSTNFSDWEQRIAGAWQTVGPALSKLSQSHITAHEVLETGRVRVAYDNGLTILINYTSSPWVCRQTTVGELDFAVIREGQ